MCPPPPSVVMNSVAKRKGLARVKRVVAHKEMLVVEVFQDPIDEYNGVESLCFFDKNKQSWMIDHLIQGDEIGVELPLKPGRGIDPVTWTLPNHDQPEHLRQFTLSVDKKVVAESSNNSTAASEPKFSFGTAKFKGEEAEWLEKFCDNYKNKGDAFEALFEAALPLLKLLQS